MSVETKEAVVLYDPDQVTVARTIAAVANIGYRASYGPSPPEMAMPHR